MLAQKGATRLGYLTRKVMAMVDDLEVAKLAQSANAGPLTLAQSASASGGQDFSQAIADAVTLSPEALRVMRQLGATQTVAEAWLEYVTAPPDPTRPVDPSGKSSLTGDKDATGGNSAAPQAMASVLNDIGWLIDAMSPPKVDVQMVAKVLAQQMAVDRVGEVPPLPEVVARAQQTGTAPALYVENLSVTVQRGRVTDASVDRVALTTIDPSLRDRVAGQERPLVVDVGGQLQELAGTALADPAARKAADDPHAVLPRERTDRSDEAARAVLILRSGGALTAEGTLRVKLDALLPLR